MFLGRQSKKGKRDGRRMHLLLSCLRPEVTHISSAHFPWKRASYMAYWDARRQKYGLAVHPESWRGWVEVSNLCSPSNVASIKSPNCCESWTLWLRPQLPSSGWRKTYILGTYMFLCDLEAFQSSAVIVTLVNWSTSILPGPVLVRKHRCSLVPIKTIHITSSETLSYVAWFSFCSNSKKSFRVNFRYIKRVSSIYAFL